ncbi:hypothetical protein AMR42_07145 [Limnothrix sp. PR1529]|nr:hypothetical protein BCR12_01580 [Limnothrix sp. P13C2]PIB14110.1 hypothetical protein AMR42_07145 [Limnothrix sp. PR1529]
MLDRQPTTQANCHHGQHGSWIGDRLGQIPPILWLSLALNGCLAAPVKPLPPNQTLKLQLHSIAGASSPP